MPDTAERPPGPLRAVSFPPALDYNPYQRLLHEALAHEDVSVVPAGGPLTPSWVARARSRVDVVHLHWLEILAFDSKRRLSGLLDPLRAARLLAALRALRHSPIRVAWTVHNAGPHERRHPRLYRRLAREAARTADVVLVHSRHAADFVARELRPRGAIEVTYHGPYSGWYADDPRAQRDIRASLGLPETAFVYLLFGQIRPYKRVPEAIRAFSQLDGDDARLVIAGTTDDPQLAAEIRRLADADRRVLLHLRWVDDDEVVTFHKACDVVVINYREVFSSGSLLLAWSLARPVVAPAGGTIDEVALPGSAETFTGDELTRALAQARQLARETGASAARAAAETHSWRAMAQTVAAAYRG